MGETEFLKVEIFEEEFDQRENCKQPKVIHFCFVYFHKESKQRNRLRPFLVKHTMDLMRGGGMLKNVNKKTCLNQDILEFLFVFS